MPTALRIGPYGFTFTTMIAANRDTCMWTEKI
jgi:hypothetical protein